MPNISSTPIVPAALTPLEQEGKSIQQFKQLLTEGMGSYIADYLRDQGTAKLMSNLMQSRRQGVWTNRDSGVSKYVQTQFNSGASISEFGQFIDVTGTQQMIFACGSDLIWYNLATTTATILTNSLPTDHTNNSDALYALFPCIREFQTTVAGTALYSILTHPQYVEPYTIDSSGTFAQFALNASAGSGYWGTLVSPIVASTIVYGYPALCEPFLNRMAYTGWPINFQISPPTGNSPSVYDILLTNAGTYDTVTQSSTLKATDGIRLQVPAICGRPTALKTIQLSNQTNSQALIVGCQRGVCLVQGTDATNMGLVILTTEFGIPSNRAILQIQNDVVFLANDGIRTFSALVINANLLTSSISYSLQDYVQQWDTNWLNQAFAVRHRTTKDIQFWMPQLNENGTSTGSFSQGNTGAVFNGTNQYLSHASNSSLRIGGTSFTWAGWVTPQSLPGTNQMIVSKTTNFTTTGDYAITIGTSSYLDFYIMNGSTKIEAENSLSTSYQFQIGQQFFIACWYDMGANTMNVQVNNGSVYTQAATITPTASTAELDFATYDGGAGDFFNGILQSMSFWKRTLSGAELSSLYNSGTPLLYAQLPPAMQTESTSTFISYWNFNENTGATRNDSRTTANNLTQHNNVSTTTSITNYIPATINLGMVFNYGDSSPDVQAVPSLDFTPSIRQTINQAAGLEFQDPNNNNQWTMFGGGYNGYLYEHYSGNTNDGAALSFTATFPLLNSGNDAVGFTVRKIHVICEGQNQNFYANAIFYEMMANGTLLPQNSQQAAFNLISGTNLETVLGEWELSQSAFPGTFVQLCEYEPIGEGRYIELQIQGFSGDNVIDLIGAHYLLSTGGTRR